MKKKTILLFVGTLLLLAGISGVYFKKNYTEKSPPERGGTSTPVVELDAIAADPKRYQDLVGVVGTVVSNDKFNNVFLLGCEGSCCVLPVKYTEQLPKVNSQVIVYGKVLKQKDDRYIFDGSNLKTK